MYIHACTCTYNYTKFSLQYRRDAREWLTQVKTVSANGGQQRATEWSQLQQQHHPLPPPLPILTLSPHHPPHHLQHTLPHHTAVTVTQKLQSLTHGMEEERGGGEEGEGVLQ